jgi:glycosyltransferase involved in cell wall biosynthesis
MFRPKCMSSLSFFFPCYNEALNVDALIEASVKVGEAYGLDYEVLIVDDGSKDNTAQIVRQWSLKNPRVRLVQHQKNQGYGAAIRTGLKQAVKDYIFLADGDNQFKVSDIEKLFSKIDGCDLVTGFRIARQDKAHRRLNGFLWTQLNKGLFQLPVRDVDCAFKLIKRKCLQGVELKANQLLIHAELIARLKKKGCRIEEIGVPHYPRTAGQATATKPVRVLKTFYELARLYWNIKKTD